MTSKNKESVTSFPNERNFEQIPLEQITTTVMEKYKKAYTRARTNNLNDINPNNLQHLSYCYFKEVSKIRSNHTEPFLTRMTFDVIKRQQKEQNLEKFINQTKEKRKENIRIKGFNRLIEDSNRRVIAKDQIKKLKTKIEIDIKKNPRKKYKNRQWNSIYNRRFLQYENEKKEKLQKKIKEKEQKEKEKEEEEIKMCKVKKAPLKIVEEYGKRLYEERFKGKMKNKKEEEVNINSQHSIGERNSKNNVNEIKDAREDEIDIANFLNPLPKGKKFTFDNIGRDKNKGGEKMEKRSQAVQIINFFFLNRGNKS